MIPDPPVREDGLCACGCGERRKTDVKSSQFAGIGDHLARDPFASARCARRFHGCELVERTSDEQIEAAKKSAAIYRSKQRKVLA